MKTSIFLPAWVAVLISGLCFGALLLAQPQEIEQPKVRAGTKIGMVNLREIYEQYVRVQEFNRDLEKELPQFKKVMRFDQYTSGGSYFLPTPNQAAKLAELKAEIADIVDEKYGDKKAALAKEIKTGIDTLAYAYGFKLVLAYGEPDILASRTFWVPEELREREVTSGGLTPVYIHRSVDLTQAVIANLNQWAAQQAQKKKDRDQ